MVRTALRDSSWMSRRALPFVFALALAVLAAPARADAGGPFFEPSALEANGYELRVSAAYYDATRTDFSRSTFLIAQRLDELHARLFLLQADLRLRITPALALQLVVPFQARELAARSAGLQVSRVQDYLPGQRFSIAGVGLSDSTISAAYRFWRSPPWAAYGELGSSFPFDDSPGSAVLPTRVPLGTGQHVLFIGAGASLREPVRLALSYRLGFSPGEHATYLIRRSGVQSYTSGALGAHWQQRAQAAAEHALYGPLSLQLTAAWTLRQWPKLIETGGRTTPSALDHWGHDLAIGAALRVQLAPGHRLELRGELPLVTTVHADPFFPLIMPARGVGVTWLVGS
jgi:hypothetical protein